jgi:phosphoglycolate phosphatase-like HAD superfamily hydrolase
MNLAIFDIDGTLTESNDIDDACYIQAFEDVLGIRGINTNWLDYRYQTDSGLAREICRQHLDRDPSIAEIGKLRSRFAGLLSLAVNSGQPIREVRGAAAVLRWLGGLPRWKPAIATGGWREPARFKLASAELPVEGLPWAHADDALDRVDITRMAISRAKERYGRFAFETIVYIGDGIWDVRAAKSLGIGFLGIAAGNRAARQMEEGALSVVPDFEDLPRVSECLELVSRNV